VALPLILDFGAARCCKVDPRAVLSRRAPRPCSNPRNTVDERVTAQTAAGYPARNSGYCRNIRNPRLESSGINGSKREERALFHSFSATRQTASADAYPERSNQLCHCPDRTERQSVGNTFKAWDKQLPLHRPISGRTRQLRATRPDDCADASGCRVRQVLKDQSTDTAERAQRQSQVRGEAAVHRAETRRHCKMAPTNERYFFVA